MKRRAFLSASATLPLAGAASVLPYASSAGSGEDIGVVELKRLFYAMRPEHQRIICELTRMLAEPRRKKMAGDGVA